MRMQVTLWGLRQTEQEALEALLDRGDVDYESRLRPKDKRYDVTFDLDEGVVYVSVGHDVGKQLLCTVAVDVEDEQEELEVHVLDVEYAREG